MLSPLLLASLVSVLAAQQVCVVPEEDEQHLFRSLTASDATRANNGSYKPIKFEIESKLANKAYKELNELIKKAAVFFESTLQVRPRKGTPKTGAGENCKGVKLSASGSFKLVVKMEKKKCDENKDLQAQAVACLRDDSNRPQGGVMSICKRTADLAKKKQKQENLLATLKHEIMHSLGISGLDKKTSVFIADPEKGTLYKPDEYQKTVQWSRTTFGGSTTKYSVIVIKTPKVLKEVRKHFDCPTLEGMPIEDQGGQGTAGSHVEKRVFGNEIMTGTQTGSSSFSRLTFALLEDSGWYKADYTKADDFTYGKGLGCDFVKKGCLSWMTKNTGDKMAPFCNDKESRKCNSDRTAAVKCTINSYSSVPAMYQYFKDANLGGVQLGDFCPTYQEYNFGKTSRDSNCGYEENQPPFDQGSTTDNSNMGLQVYGAASRCIEITSNSKVTRDLSSMPMKLGCYKVVCEGDGGRFNIEISTGDGTNSKHLETCYATDQALHVNRDVKGSTYKFSLKCPPCNVVCPKQKCAPDDETKASESDGDGASQNTAGSLAILIALIIVSLA